MDEGDVPVMPWRDPMQRATHWRLDSQGGADARAIFDRLLAESTHLHHPRCFGHQVSAPDPLSALARFVVAALNATSAIDEMGPTGVMMERAVVRWMCDHIGYDDRAGGVFVSGGSLGNLTALLAMRQRMAGFDAWSQGAHAGEALAVLASDQSHYSIQRAAQVMGWGHDGVVPVETDGDLRLRPDALEAALKRARALGRRVIGVITASCCTPTGTFDPIEPVADFCEAHDLWLHVDGAHGASLLLTESRRQLLCGIERADSVLWDAHKLLGVPALATGVLYRDASHAAQAFSQDASYVFTSEETGTWVEPGLCALECTKPSLAAPLYVLLATAGEEYLARHIDQVIDRAQFFASEIRKRSGFTLCTEPECNIVCFRYEPDGLDPAATDALLAAVRTEIIRSGGFYFTQTRIRGRLWLRITVMNDATTEEDLVALLGAVQATAEQLNSTPAAGSPQRA
jgi:L-2,4-diaminobutyrate decarboxylase